MHIVGVIIAIAVLVAVGISTSRANKKRQEEFIAWAVPRAEEIARHQGWVSPHRLINQAHMTRSDAQTTLREACNRGILFQAVNGRYYIKS
jgi:hypothetical protein